MFLRPIHRLANGSDLDEPPVVAGAYPKRGLGVVAEKIASIDLPRRESPDHQGYYKFRLRRPP